MLLSMTGFGKAVVEHDGRKITVEIKSLNSKQMDLNMKLPPMLREVELELRNRISRRLERGKVDVVITMESIGGENGSSLNLKAMADYKAQIEEASDLLGIPRPTDWYSLLLRMPEVLVPRVDNELETDIVEVLESAVDEAVEALMQFRTCEGNKLMDFSVCAWMLLANCWVRCLATKWSVWKRYVHASRRISANCRLAVSIPRAWSRR